MSCLCETSPAHANLIKWPIKNIAEEHSCKEMTSVIPCNQCKTQSPISANKSVSENVIFSKLHGTLFSCNTHPSLYAWQCMELSPQHCIISNLLFLKCGVKFLAPRARVFTAWKPMVTFVWECNTTLPSSGTILHCGYCAHARVWWWIPST